MCGEQMLVLAVILTLRCPVLLGQTQRAVPGNLDDELCSCTPFPAKPQTAEKRVRPESPADIISGNETWAEAVPFKSHSSLPINLALLRRRVFKFNVILWQGKIALITDSNLSCIITGWALWHGSRLYLWRVRACTLRAQEGVQTDYHVATVRTHLWLHRTSLSLLLTGGERLNCSDTYWGIWCRYRLLWWLPSAELIYGTELQHYYPVCT